MVRFLGLILIAQLLTACGCQTIDTGYRGIEKKFGKIQGEPLGEGLHWYNPFTSEIVEIKVQEEKWEEKTPCFTKDTQQVQVAFAVTYYPDPAKIGELYRQYGEKWNDKIVAPIVLQSIKDTVGQYVADDLVSKREIARNAAFEEVKTSLQDKSVLVTSLSLTNLDFDDAYEHAVEAKVVAVQKAAESKNKTVEIEEQAKQKVIAAEAEAKSMQIRSQALSQNKSLVEYEAVQKWDGKLPQYMLSGGTMPFLNLGAK